LAGENLGKKQAKLHLAKKTLANLSPAPSYFRYCKQLADNFGEFIVNRQIGQFFPAKIFCYTVFE